MIDLSPIKSEKLKKLMSVSLKFRALPNKEQRKKVEQIAKISQKEQEKLYCPIFEKENKKEEPLKAQKEQALLKLIDKMEEMDRMIKKMAREDLENNAEKNERKKEKKLLKELNS